MNDTVKILVDGQTYVLPLTEELDLRLQDVSCNLKGHLCGLFKGQPCCLEPNLKNGKLEIDMSPCSKSKNFEISLKLKEE